MVCSDINVDAAKETVQLIQDQTSGKAFAVQCDVTDKMQVQALSDQAEQLMNHAVTLVINNAGVGLGGRFEDEKPILLQAGMCTTVEPGLYIAAAPDIPAHFHNIGVRIEDNVLVTADGHENYTHEVPKTIAEIEALMAG